MSVQDIAASLRRLALRSESLEQCARIRADAENIADIVANLVGDGHLATTAVTGQAAAVVEAVERAESALHTLEFVMNNIADSLTQSGS